MSQKTTFHIVTAMKIKYTRKHNFVQFAVWSVRLSIMTVMTNRIRDWLIGTLGLLQLNRESPQNVEWWCVGYSGLVGSRDRNVGNIVPSRADGWNKPRTGCRRASQKWSLACIYHSIHPFLPSPYERCKRRKHEMKYKHRAPSVCQKI
jgi:hypothetical protein